MNYSQAAMQAVNLSASAYWVPENKLDYLNYGAAISEVASYNHWCFHL